MKPRLCWHGGGRCTPWRIILSTRLRLCVRRVCRSCLWNQLHRKNTAHASDIARSASLDNNLITNYTQGKALALGERIRVHGQVLDENARPVPDTLIEIWQANAGGRYRHIKDTYFAPLDPNFGGCGRTLTDANGSYEFFTVRPGAYPWPNRANDWRPMHIHFSIFGHAFGQRLISQMYFEGDPLIELCPIVATVRKRSQLERLIAPLDMQNARSMDYLAYKFDIVLRGYRQTKFENKPQGM